jgi:hypothetical protein
VNSELTELILGNSYAVFAGFTVTCMCSAAAFLGMTFAREWRPARHLLPFGIALGLIDRLVAHALFQADLFSPGGFTIDTYCILLAAVLAYRLTLAAQLQRQYPWIYRRFLLFGWRRIPTRSR